MKISLSFLKTYLYFFMIRLINKKYMHITYSRFTYAIYIYKTKLIVMHFPQYCQENVLRTFCQEYRRNIRRCANISNFRTRLPQRGVISCYIIVDRYILHQAVTIQTLNSPDGDSHLSFSTYVSSYTSTDYSTMQKY